MSGRVCGDALSDKRTARTSETGVVRPGRRQSGSHNAVCAHVPSPASGCRTWPCLLHHQVQTQVQSIIKITRGILFCIKIFFNDYFYFENTTQLSFIEK